MPRTRWNLEELRLHVRAKRQDAARVLEVVDSIGRGVHIFRYHMATARDAMNGLINEAEPQGVDNFMLTLGGSDRQQDFAFARIVCEAHLIGCLQTARSLWDLYAQLVNALLLPNPLAVDACDIRRVATRLLASCLKERLDTLLASYWYKYVAAFVNTTKHRVLIQHRMTVSMEEDRAGIKIEGFDYASQVFKSYWARELLEGSIEVKNAIIECGGFLNAAYATHDAQPSIPADVPQAARR